MFPRGWPIVLPHTMEFRYIGRGISALAVSPMVERGTGYPILYNPNFTHKKSGLRAAFFGFLLGPFILNWT